MIEELVDQAMKEVNNRIDVLPFWQQEAIRRLITEAVQLAYKQGRDDQLYAIEGPHKIDLYE